MWTAPSADIPNLLASWGYEGTYPSGISVGGITDSFLDDWLDSEGDVIYDSLWVSEPGNPYGINSIITYGYWNSIASQLNARIVTFGYLGSLAIPLVWLTDVLAKSWVALNSKFRMR